LRRSPIINRFAGDRQPFWVYGRDTKGIGTPATRAEIIGGLKKQGFLIAEAKHIVPTEAGLSLFGVLKQATRPWSIRG
jgi:DNA topoisomerase IA